MKKSSKSGMFVLSFLLATGIFAQTSVCAKGNSGGSHGKSQVHEKAVKAVPYGLAKKDLPPVIKQGGFLIPVNAVKKSLGADVTWDAENQSVTIIKDGTTIIINLGTKTATVNGVETALPGELAIVTDAATPVDTVEGTAVVVTSDVTATTETESITKNGTRVLLSFIAENLKVDLDAATEEQIVDEALTEDAAQAAETGTADGTPAVGQTSTDL